MGGESNGRKVITVRLPAELHQAASEAAHDTRQSMNTFAIAALEAAVVQVKTDRERERAAPGRE